MRRMRGCTFAPTNDDTEPTFTTVACEGVLTHLSSDLTVRNTDLTLTSITRSHSADRAIDNSFRQQDSSVVNQMVDFLESADDLLKDANHFLLITNVGGISCADSRRSLRSAPLPSGTAPHRCQ